ncbi:MAG: hypothetical protein AAFY99_11430 [Pseudomonadota bacterium]
MPFMHLPDDNTHSLHFLSYLIWPNDELSRLAYVTLSSERQIHLVDDSLLNELDAPEQEITSAQRLQLEELKRVIARSIDPETRTKIIAEGFGLRLLQRELTRNFREFRLASIVALYLAGMIENHQETLRPKLGPGINKAVDAVVEILRGSATGTGTNTVRKCWEKYKSVAYFGAPVMALEIPIKEQFREFAVANPALFEASCTYRRILSRFVPKGRNEPTIEFEEMWLLPEKLVPAKWRPIPVPALPDQVLKFLIDERIARRGPNN